MHGVRGVGLGRWEWHACGENGVTHVYTRTGELVLYSRVQGLVLEIKLGLVVRMAGATLAVHRFNVEAGGDILSMHACSATLAVHMQGRSKHSGQSGFGRTTFQLVNQLTPSSWSIFNT